MKLSPIYPIWLLAIIAVILIAMVVIPWLKRRKTGVAARLSLIIRLTCVALLLFAALNPSVPGGRTNPGLTNIDALFLVDTTASMGALDYQNGKQRIDGAKQDMQKLAQKMVGSRFAIITFDSKANLILPYTADSSAVSTATQTLNQEVYAYAQGSSIDEPIDLAMKTLAHSQQEHPDKSRLVFYIGDGEQTAHKAIKSFAPLKQYIKGGAVMGYGTSGGAKMLKYTGFADLPAQDSDFGGKYIQTLDKKTFQFVPAISKVNDANLKTIASQLGIDYTNMTDAKDINNLYDAAHVQYIADNTREVTDYLKLYWVFAVPLVGLLVWELDRLIRLQRAIRKRGVKHG